MCQACEVRFYDLARKPIVCPSCGAAYTVAPARPLISTEARAPSGGKTGWRSKGLKRPPIPLPPEDAEQNEPEIAQDAPEVAEQGADDDLVLEQDSDDGDVTDLVGRDIVEPKPGS